MASVPRPAATAPSAAGGSATPAGSAAGTAAQRDIHAHRILILDFGAQYTQLIARRVRELGVYCEIHPWDMSDAGVRAFGARGVILSGGPETVTTASAPGAPAAVYELGVPVLGICYGMQTMAQQLGGRVAPGTEREFGYAEVTVTGASRLLDELADRRNPAGRAVLDVWMSHGDRVDALPPGFSATAATGAIPLAAMSDERRRFYGVQFHPEVTHTTQGTKLLERFVREICGADALWSVGNIIEDALARLRAQVGGGKVLLGLSGGVDSSVVAALLHRAIGEQLTCVFVDHGLLRLGEAESVMSVFAQHLGVRVVRVDAQARFLGALAGITDPEAKRKAVGRTFVEVFDEQARSLKGVEFLAQGTIYPDVIESAGARTGKAQVIKSHHNVGGLPERMRLKLVEPLRELFKDEVRRLSTELGLPRELTHRHPFPGQLLHGFQDVADELRVEGAGGLVEHHQLGVHGQRSGDRHPLLLPATELPRQRSEPRAKPDGLQSFLRPSFRAPAADRLARGTAPPPGERRLAPPARFPRSMRASTCCRLR